MSSRVVFRGIGLAALMVCLLIAGCGGGRDGFDISGKVTFDGQPVPAGKIYFNPDGSKGNSGASGFATIKDGAFDTAAEGGAPHVGGAMIVAIEGMDPSEKTEDPESGEQIMKVLFPLYETPAELPKETGTMDFDVPATAGERSEQGEGGGASGGP